MCTCVCPCTFGVREGLCLERFTTNSKSKRWQRGSASLRCAFASLCHQLRERRWNFIHKGWNKSICISEVAFSVLARTGSSPGVKSKTEDFSGKQGDGRGARNQSQRSRGEGGQPGPWSAEPRWSTSPSVRDNQSPHCKMRGELVERLRQAQLRGTC